MSTRNIFILFICLLSSSVFGQQALIQQRADLEMLVAQGDYPKALKKANEIKIITEKEYGTTDTEHAKSLLDLAVVYYYLYDCSNSESIIESAKTIYASKKGVHSYEYANVLQNQSYILLNCNKNELAEHVTTQAVKIIQESIVDSTLLLASLYSDLGYIQTTLGKINEAKLSYNKSYTLMNKYNFTHTDAYAFLLNNIANLYHDISDYVNAKKYYDESLIKHKDLFGNNSSEYATVLNNEGILFLDFGYYEEGAQQIFKAAAITKSTLGETSLEYAKSMNDIGNVYDKESDYKKAELYYNKSLELKKVLGVEGRVTYWNTMNNLALLYARLGNYSQAISTLQAQLALVKKYKGEKQAEYGNYLNSMGAVYESSGDYSNAAIYFNQALTFYKIYYGTSDPNYSRVLNNLGLLAAKQNNPNKAIQYYKQSIACIENDSINNQLDIADSYNNIGELYSLTGDYKNAALQLQKSLNIYDRVLGRKHPTYWNCYSNNALLDYRAGNTTKAIAETQNVLDMNISMVYDNFSFLSESEKLKYWNKTYSQFEFYYSLCLKEYATHPELIGSMYDYSLATKSIVFNYTTQLKSKIQQSGNVALLNSYQEWQDKKQLLATYYNFTKQQIQDNEIDLSALEIEVNLLEKNISSQSADFKIAREIKNVRWKDIQVKLKENEAAVQIMRVELFNNVWSDSIVYVALILTKETTSNPIVVVLKNGNKLENKYYKGFLNAIKFGQVPEEFYTVYWKEIDQHIHTKTVVYVAPEGVYNKISLPTLRLPDGTYLLEKRNIQLTPLLRNLAVINSTHSTKGTGAYLFGYPNYNLALEQDQSSTRINKNAIEREELRGYQLNELPGTKIEVEDIASILLADGLSTQVLTGNNATESEIKKLNNPSILHIATHGYFVKDYEISVDSNAVVNYKENPLLRSGILLAGSNYTLNNQSFGNPFDDGILTAYEAMQLKLDKTDLVILSACETGLGEEMNGEGVLGLQRAFMLAGADNVLMSLWKVSDGGTQQLMKLFYKYWVQDKNTGDALRKAQLELMKTYPSPYYWGAFVYIK